MLWWTRRAAGTAGCLAAQAGDDLTEEIDRSEEAEATETVEAVDRADDATLQLSHAPARLCLQLHACDARVAEAFLQTQPMLRQRSEACRRSMLLQPGARQH